MLKKMVDLKREDGAVVVLFAILMSSVLVIKQIFRLFTC